MDFLNGLKREQTVTRTTNGARAYNTTDNPILDFFAVAGAMRNKSESDLTNLFYKAFYEDKLIAMKLLFYFRDIREGQGERQTFRVVLKELAFSYPEIVKNNLDNISEYGRYDDMLVLLDTPLKKDVCSYIDNQLKLDSVSQHPSLLAKWLPSPRTSSNETKRYAKIIRKSLNMTEEKYRKTLSFLRKKIRVTETIISANKWNELDLEKLTANNYIKYRQAFDRHLRDEFEEYLDRVKNGRAVIKSNTLYPYDIVRKCKSVSSNEKDLFNELWKALPDYIDDDVEIMPVIDVSGSMFGYDPNNVHPIDVAVGLGLYIAERNKSVFKNHFITFSSKPQLVEIKGENLIDKIKNIQRADWGMSTNLERTFDLILDVAIKNNLSQEQFPKKLIIISDMQFNQASQSDKTLFDALTDKFNLFGYKLPCLVFWNVNNTKTAFQVKEDNPNVLLVSGCSPILMKQVLKYNSPMDVVMDIVNSKRYEAIKL